MIYRTESGEQGFKTDSYTPEQKQILAEVIEVTKLRFAQHSKEVSGAHGIQHIEIVAQFARYLAAKERVDPFEVEVAAWLHDWGRIGESGRLSRGCGKKHAEVSREKAKRMLLQQYFEDGRLTEKQYLHILGMVSEHSKLPEGKSKENKVLRDADRVSRFGIMGLWHVILYDLEKRDIPFYQKGRPIERDVGQPVEADIECVVDDINYTKDWYKILETPRAKELVDKYCLLSVYREFLKTFAKFNYKVPQDAWVDWVREVAGEIQKKQDVLTEEIGSENKERLLEEMLKLNNPEFFNEESLAKFLTDRHIEL